MREVIAERNGQRPILRSIVPFEQFVVDAILPPGHLRTRLKLSLAPHRQAISLQGDIGLDFSSKYISGQFALFANKIDNYIFLSKTAEGNPPVFTYTSGNARLLGGEAQLDFHPIHSLHLGTTFSYVNGKQIGGAWLPMIPAPRLLTECKWEITHDGQLLNNAFVAVEVDWNSRMEDHADGHIPSGHLHRQKSTAGPPLHLISITEAAIGI